MYTLALRMTFHAQLFVDGAVLTSVFVFVNLLWNRPVLTKVKEKSTIPLPGWISVPVSVVEETPVSQLSQVHRLLNVSQLSQVHRVLNVSLDRNITEQQWHQNIESLTARKKISVKHI